VGGPRLRPALPDLLQRHASELIADRPGPVALPRVRSLDFPQLVPVGEGRDLLRTLWFMFAAVEDCAVMRSKADVEVTKIMSLHMWEVMRDPQSVHGALALRRPLPALRRTLGLAYAYGVLWQLERANCTFDVAGISLRDKRRLSRSALSER